MLRLLLSALLGLTPLLMVGGATEAFHGRVVDARSGAPIGGAMVTLADQVVLTAPDGGFEIRGPAGPLGVRAVGYARTSIATDALASAPGRVSLTPLRPRALYLTSLGLASRSLREAVLAIADTSEVNALVVDLKGDRGTTAYPSTVPLAISIGAERSPVVEDLRAEAAALHAHGLYLIARIVVFKDNVLAAARPDLAVRSADGHVWRDREGLAWVDPFSREVWEYNAALAMEAARAGFDEIQFDYVRFPDARQLAFSGSPTETNRVAAIAGFLDLARRRLMPYNVFLAADAFGYVCWNLDDTGIGQTLAAMLQSVDYLSPMLYPSGFQFGIPGYRDPVAHPREVVMLSLKQALQRAHVAPVRLRPWLQAFQDYAFDRRAFGPELMRAQAQAADESGSDGWMFWNPRNVYPEAAFEPRAGERPQAPDPVTPPPQTAAPARPPPATHSP